VNLKKHPLNYEFEKLKNMKNLFNNDSVKEVLQRIDSLQIDSEKLWGKMDVAQMVAHCSETMKMATGQRFPPRVFIGRIIGRFFKANYYNDKPFAKDSPTSKSAIIDDKRDLEKEKVILKTLILQFYEGGTTKCTTHLHPFFGHLTPEQWSIGMYKHLDHHLRQFNS
jgi:Protein of unknown function (DUF1569)